MPYLSPNQRNLLFLAIALAASYLFAPFPEGSILNILQKSSAAFLLGILSFWATKGNRTKKLLLVALLASSAGDAFLAIRSSDYFTQGLGAFLIAHLLYISILARARAQGKTSSIKQFGCALIFLFSVGMMVLLWPSLGALKAPVFVYIAVITTMAILAITSTYPGPIVIIGAISFLVSDATIALNKFIFQFSMASPAIWITYIAAQVLLTLAIIKGPPIKNADT